MLYISSSSKISPSVVLATVLTTLLLVVAMPDVVDEAPEVMIDAEAAPAGQLMPVTLHFMGSDHLTPTPPSIDDDEIRRTVQNGFVSGRIKQFGSVQWKHVGTWSSDAIHTDLLMSESATFSIWAENEFRVSGKFRFSILANGQQPPVIGPIETGTHYIDDEPSRIEVTANLGSNVTPLHKSDRMEIRVEGAVNGGCTVLYGSGNFASGMSVTCNGLAIEKFEKKENYIQAQVLDTWGVERHSIFKQVTVNGLVLEMEPNYQLSNDLQRQHLWEWFIGDLEPGNHEVVIVFAYGEGYAPQTQTISIEMLPETNIIARNEETFDILLPALIVGTIILLVVAFLLIMFLRKRYQDDPQKRDMSTGIILLVIGIGGLIATVPISMFFADIIGLPMFIGVSCTLVGLLLVIWNLDRTAKLKASLKKSLKGAKPKKLKFKGKRSKA